MFCVLPLKSGIINKKSHRKVMKMCEKMGKLVCGFCVKRRKLSILRAGVI